MDECVTVFIFIVITKISHVTQLILMLATTMMTSVRRTIMSPNMGGTNRRCLAGVVASSLRLLRTSSGSTHRSMLRIV